MDLKKLLIVNDHLISGGVERLMLDIVWAWHTKYNITVLTNEYRENAEQILPDDVEYIYRYIKKEESDQESLIHKVRKIHHLRKTNQYIKEKGFDCLLSMKDGWTMLECMELQFIPHRLAWVHTDYSNYHYTTDIFDNIENELNCMKSFSWVICVSNVIKESICSIIGDPGNLVVKYNPLNVRDILIKAEEPVVELETEKKCDLVRFVTVGRLNYQKGYDLLLEACHMLEAEGFKFEVWIVGGEEPWGAEHGRLYRAQSRLGLQSVKFIGGKRNPYKYIAQADWFLSSSIFEGYSLVSQEAAILGIPLLLTDCSGVRELVGNQEYGLIMEISVKGIYEGMKNVILHPELHEIYKNRILERKSIITYEQRLREIEQLL